MFFVNLCKKHDVCNTVKKGLHFHNNIIIVFFCLNPSRAKTCDHVCNLDLDITVYDFPPPVILQLLTNHCGNHLNCGMWKLRFILVNLFTII